MQLRDSWDPTGMSSDPLRLCVIVSGKTRFHFPLELPYSKFSPVLADLVQSRKDGEIEFDSKYEMVIEAVFKSILQFPLEGEVHLLGYYYSLVRFLELRGGEDSLLDVIVAEIRKFLAAFSLEPHCLADFLLIAREVFTVKCRACDALAVDCCAHTDIAVEVLETLARHLFERFLPSVTCATDFDPFSFVTHLAWERIFATLQFAQDYQDTSIKLCYLFEYLLARYDLDDTLVLAIRDRCSAFAFPSLLVASQKALASKNEKQRDWLQRYASRHYFSNNELQQLQLPFEDSVKSSEVISVRGTGAKQYECDGDSPGLFVGLKRVPIPNRKGLAVVVLNSNLSIKAQFDTTLPELEFATLLSECSDSDILLIASYGPWEHWIPSESRKALANLICTEDGKALLTKDWPRRDAGQPLAMVLMPNLFCRYAILAASSNQSALLEVDFKFSALRNKWCPAGTSSPAASISCSFFDPPDLCAIFTESGPAKRSGPAFCKEWNHVVLNKIQFNNLGLSLDSGGTITCAQGGLYKIRASLPIYQPGQFYGRLFSVTRNETLISGTGGYSGYDDGFVRYGKTIGVSDVVGIVQLCPNETVRFEMWSSRAGFKWSASSAFPLEIVNSVVEITKCNCWSS